MNLFEKGARRNIEVARTFKRMKTVKLPFLIFHVNILPKEEKLSGSIPPEIGELKALTHLDLHGNELSGSIPPKIGQLKTLTKLILFYHQLSGSIPRGIGHLKALKELHLEKTSFRALSRQK